MTVPDTARAIGRAALSAFGGQPNVHRYYDEDESHAVDVLMCADRPAAGFASYSTLTLHSSPNWLDDADVRVEMCGVAATAAGSFPNMLATAAFFVAKEGWLCAPGVVFPGLVAEYGLSTTLEHVLWMPPSPWPALNRQTVGEALDVHWLLAVPISSAERTFLRDQGYDTLIALFDERQLEYFDLERPSVV